jgi:hypothetical protein
VRSLMPGADTKHCPSPGTPPGHSTDSTYITTTAEAASTVYTNRGKCNFEDKVRAGHCARSQAP